MYDFFLKVQEIIKKTFRSTKEKAHGAEESSPRHNETPKTTPPPPLRKNPVTVKWLRISRMLNNPRRKMERGFSSNWMSVRWLAITPNLAVHTLKASMALPRSPRAPKQNDPVLQKTPLCPSPSRDRKHPRVEEKTLCR